MTETSVANLFVFAGVAGLGRVLIAIGESSVPMTAEQESEWLVVCAPLIAKWRSQVAWGQLASIDRSLALRDSDDSRVQARRLERVHSEGAELLLLLADDDTVGSETMTKKIVYGQPDDEAKLFLPELQRLRADVDQKKPRMQLRREAVEKVLQVQAPLDNAGALQIVDEQPIYQLLETLSPSFVNLRVQIEPDKNVTPAVQALPPTPRKIAPSSHHHLPTTAPAIASACSIM